MIFLYRVPGLVPGTGPDTWYWTGTGTDSKYLDFF